MNCWCLVSSVKPFLRTITWPKIHSNVIFFRLSLNCFPLIFLLMMPDIDATKYKIGNSSGLVKNIWYLSLRVFVLVQEKLWSVSLPGLSWAGGGSQYIYLGAILGELCGDNTPHSAIWSPPVVYSTLLSPVGTHRTRLPAPASSLNLAAQPEGTNLWHQEYCAVLSVCGINLNVNKLTLRRLFNLLLF